LLTPKSKTLTAAPYAFDAIILITASRWDQDFSSASISMARELSKTHRVYFIDNPFTIKDVIKGWRSPAIRKRISALFFGVAIYRQIEPDNLNWIAVTPHMVLPINWLPKGGLYSFFSKLNNLIFCCTLKRLIREMKLKQYLLFNSYNPFYAYKLPADVKPKLVIYQSRDNISESEYVSKHGPVLEQIAAQHAAIRLATSTYLVEKLSSPQYPFHFLPNAADVSLFNRAQNKSEVPELVNIAQPVIGYMGNICLRIDYDLLYKVACEFSSCTLLMVGPRNDRAHHAIDFTRLKNVIFVGAKNIKQLPEYLSIMNCAIMPFKKNKLTRSIYPLKINEYLAGGKPVVSTSFSPDIESFGDVVYVSQNHDEFLANIRLALAETGAEKARQRIAVASQNSWPARVNQFWNIITSYQS